MVAGLTYSTYVTQIAQLTVIQSTDVNFQAILPAMIDYAELRIYQDLDLLSTVTPQLGFSLATGNRNLTIPIQNFITLQQINVLTPAGSSDPNSSSRNPCLPVTKEFLDMVYGSSAITGLPRKFAMISQNTLAFGPWPDMAYSLEIVGTVRPASLSSGNTSTFISTYLPDLMIMASMVYISLFQRNFLATANDPQMPGSYESQYMSLMKISAVEEGRKKFSSVGWTSMSPPIAATPTRG